MSDYRWKIEISNVSGNTCKIHIDNPTSGIVTEMEELLKKYNDKPYDKMMVGYSKGKRELIRKIKDAIKELADENGRAAREIVLDLLVQKGIDRAEAQKQLEMLLTSGEAMETTKGVISLI